MRGSWNHRSGVEYRVRRAAAVGGALLVLLPLLTGTAGAQQAEPKWWGGEELRLDLVGTTYWVEGIQPAGGWPLTVSLQAKNWELLGIGTEVTPPTYPAAERTGYLVFDDPDGCPSFVGVGWQLQAYDAYHCQDPPSEVYAGCVPPYMPDDPAWPTGVPACPPEDGWTDWISQLTDAGVSWVRDETWAEFTPGISTLDELGAIANAEDVEFRPDVWSGAAGSWTLQPYGPELGSVHDHITYGHSRRIPGLVIVADHGPGVRWVEPVGPAPANGFFDALEPAEAWNLAGFVNSVAYSLKGGTGETSLLAHLNVPRQLFLPVVLADNNLEDDVETADGTCDADTAGGVYRMDGGPLRCYEEYFGTLDDLLFGTTVTVRVFMVDGVAPDILIDQDGDGDLDSRDAELMGYDPISRQETMRFRQWAEDQCGYRYDFDGNGNPGFCVAPARPGGIVRPPR